VTDPRDISDTSAVVIGGGFYGARLALMLRAYGSNVVLVEREPMLLGRASLRNQARVHNGYHYPRSILTSLRSRMNYARFLGEYAECVERSFPHYYAVGRGMSKITAHQFATFCGRIGAPLRPAPDRVAARFDHARIESVFQVEECAFDAARLRARVCRDLSDAGVCVMVGTEARRIEARGSGRREAIVTVHRDDELLDLHADLVLNCTYSRVNHVLAASGASTIALKHQCTEMALIEPPPELDGAAVTVMDGPFFSMMPYPSRGLFTLSHVRYTPHCSWVDTGADGIVDGDATLQRASRAIYMIRDAERYLPCLRRVRHVDSLFEVKTVMPRSEKDDSRPILLRRSEEIPACLNVLGAKIDSVYDVEDALRTELASRPIAPAMAVAL
jgi:glycine/D-amino acid oxidase-like deaminating enzyme